ncbi:efflux RND transporter periplasmic adaptor subunit [Microbulbifer thermotolerans]|uniref:Efflux transporter periplasmic adaptor subunit n=1 Tax=Microbulbifer thermotolerans TaxID=252514 RepID=A0A143HL68_MICTH|nr:efflux RND transporter periplasmic adaptor subunit [Microbulbifer thermotolerans]AMX02438.1 efflux transporter periplasmic adaptor subunit [Microbulbifer thermotolerans]MCX2780969.1 efflux RND transporter periplasmic adaptor subunit [Microbulbifer thermotolerans]MCX2784501.1 efflux RND transporter periplasmic adaptor subunit [Microbulbifer thermotolerans]MCX2795239.1 efflux RND transporter periplasmic adaptor subunit [Microbulbifer thermotolerans]MCX2806589.1 efflux RND transporter periplas
MLKQLKRLNWNFALPIALILLAVLIASWLLRDKPTMSRGDRKTPPPTVDTVVAERGQFPLTVTGLGLVTARETVELQPQVEGRVEWIDYGLGPGSTLERGQPLLRIEAEPYQLALQTARSTLAERRAELQQEEGQRAVAQEEYALLGATLPEADRALVLREPQLAAARARVDSAEAQVRLAERDLRLTRITSPFTALLVSRSVDVGDRVAPGTELYTLAGAERFQIEVEVPASRLRYVSSPDTEVRIRGSQWPEDQYRQGDFVRAIPVLEEQGRLARVLVELKDPLAIDDPSQPQLLLNDLAQVEITARTTSDRVRVPLTAVQDGDVVWIVQGNRIQIRPVNIEYLSDDYAVLASGLRGGERLVTTRLTTVTSGMPVRVAGEEPVQRPEALGMRAPGAEGEPRQRQMPPQGRRGE